MQSTDFQISIQFGSDKNDLGLTIGLEIYL